MDIELTADRVFLASGYTDMRKSIDGLSVIIQKQFNLDSFQPSLFLFCGRKRDRIKGLLLRGMYNVGGIDSEADTLAKEGLAQIGKLFKLEQEFKELPAVQR